MSAPLGIRLARADDEPAVAALWRAVFGEERDWRTPEAIFARRRTHAGNLLLVATRDEVVVGTVMAGYDGHRGWIYRLAVLPEHRRGGIARALLAEAERRLVRLGCAKLNLQIEGDNAAVSAFYERVGFAHEDRVSMGKALAPAAPAPSRAISVGVYLPQVGFTWDELRARVVACDQDGIDAVWFMDHLYPPGLPAVPSFEAWTTAAALAAVTSRIRLGHLVLANGLRHPALLAKMAVTLDHASGGRLELGLGSGSVAQEFAQAGLPVPPARERAERLDEALHVLKRVFTEPTATWTGRHYALDALPSLPRPVQQPHPPITVGGAGVRWTLPVVARHADVWNCPTYALATLPATLAALHAACVEVGRDPRTLRVSEEAVLALVPRRADVDAARAAALRRFPGPGWGFEAGGYCGTPDDVVARIRARAALGVQGVIFVLADRAAPETIRLLAREVLPALS